MRRHSISVPVAIDLTKEQAWEALDNKGRSFFVVRFHFQLDERHLLESHKVGDWIGLYQSTKGMSAQHITSETTEVEQILSTKSIASHLTRSETLAELANELVGKIELPKLLNLDAGVKSLVSEKLINDYKIGVEIADSQKVTKRVELRIENHYPADETEAIVSVPVYRKRALDIHISFIDFLKVEYKTTAFGLRKKCQKLPRFGNSRRPPNVRKIGAPIATVYYWELQESSSKFMYEQEHNIEVRDPSQIVICEPVCSKPKYVEFPDVPTLYQVAKATFPHKWIWRRSETGEWTEEQLKNIEIKEAKSTNSGWYRRYGRTNK